MPSFTDTVTLHLKPVPVSTRLPNMLSVEPANHTIDPMKTIHYLLLLLALSLLFLCPSCKTAAPVVTTPHNDSIVIRNIYHHDSIYLRRIGQIGRKCHFAGWNMV